MLVEPLGKDIDAARDTSARTSASAGMASMDAVTGARVRGRQDNRMDQGSLVREDAKYRALCDAPAARAI